MINHQKKIQHLYLRAGFGETPKNIHSKLSYSTNDLVEELFQTSVNFKKIEYLPYPLKDNEEKKGAGGLKLVLMFLKSFGEMEELNKEWLFKMTYTKAVLREKMTLFWHNHFATSTPFAYLMQEQNNTIRHHALGKFSDLLHAVSKDPAMILYLNNQQNRKDHPNENFAREVMELFTLGVGHYTEKDIQEAARAFTGWTVNTKGEYQFNEKDFDNGEKTVFGKKGNFKGEEIIEMLLQNKQTAKFITTKIYEEFVNPDINPDRINELSNDFYQSGYDISFLMKKIFTSDWFFLEENIGCKIISPVELIVRYKKLLGIEFKKFKTLINLQKSLGQLLFFPPNVAGWRGNRNWIDSSSLLLRLNLPLYLKKGEGLNIKSKPQFEEKPEEKEIKYKGGKIEVNWSEITEHYKTITDDNLQDELLNYYIQCPHTHINKKIIALNDTTLRTKNDVIISLSLNIMSIPEFQLI